MKAMVYGLFVLVGLIGSTSVLADSKPSGKVIAGWVELIAFGKEPALVKAKLDTGAKTSSIHAINVKKFKRDGENWVSFKLMLEDKDGKLHQIDMEAPRSRRVKIKNHDGVHDKRMVVELPLCFDGRNHIAEFTLADRSEYIYSVLLGREFLEGVAVVDSGATFLTLPKCK